MAAIWPGRRLGAGLMAASGRIDGGLAGSAAVGSPDLRPPLAMNGECQRGGLYAEFCHDGSRRRGWPSI
jgi:hypothetical protein